MSWSNSRNQSVHPIGVVSRRTGLKPERLRAWERRYGAVRPGRSAGGRRLYSEAQVERLWLLAQATTWGHAISYLVTLSDSSLRELIAWMPAPAVSGPTNPSAPSAPAAPAAPAVDDEAAEVVVRSCLEAVSALDAARLLDELERAAGAFSRRGVVEKVLEPLMRQIGERWRDGVVRPVHEHLATTTVRLFAARLPGVRRTVLDGPALVATTPPEERHELGALLVAATASAEGWNATYLGPDLPVDDVVLAARTTGARAVAMSLVCPTVDTVTHIRRLAGQLPSEVTLIVGGGGAQRVEAALAGCDIVFPGDLEGLRHTLATLA